MIEYPKKDELIEELLKVWNLNPDDFIRYYESDFKNLSKKTLVLLWEAFVNGKENNSGKTN